MKINAEWHKANKMPKNPSELVRLKWHVQHAQNCSCRELSPKLIEAIKQAGLKL